MLVKTMQKSISIKPISKKLDSKKPVTKKSIAKKLDSKKPVIKDQKISIQKGGFNKQINMNYYTNFLIQLTNDKLVCEGNDNSLNIFNINLDNSPKIDNSTKLIELKGHKRPVTCVTQLDDDYIVSGSYDKTLIIWDINKGTQLMKLKGHTSPVKCVTKISNNCIVSGSFDKTLRVWNIISKRKIYNTLFKSRTLMILKGHTSLVTCVTKLSDDRIVSGSEDTTLIIWDINTGKILKKLEGHTNYVTCVIKLSDDRIVSGSYDHTLIIWNISTNTNARHLRFYTIIS